MKQCAVASEWFLSNIHYNCCYHCRMQANERKNPCFWNSFIRYENQLRRINFLNIEISYSMHLLKMRVQWTRNYNGNSEKNICRHFNHWTLSCAWFVCVCVCGNDGCGVPFCITFRWKIPEMRNEILLTHRTFITNDQMQHDLHI